MIYPLNHVINFFQNFVLIFFYLSTIMATASANLKFFETTKIFTIILLLFSVYSLILKFTADQVCEFWTLAWHKVLLHLSVYAFEGLMVCSVFGWYVGKSSKVRNQMKLCIERLAPRN